jgi:hypothetical protein
MQHYFAMHALRSAKHVLLSANNMMLIIVSDALKSAGSVPKNVGRWLDNQLDFYEKLLGEKWGSVTNPLLPFCILSACQLHY